MVDLVKGTLIATSDGGDIIELSEGDVYTFEPGWSGTWRMPVPMRKFFTTFTA